MISRREFLRGSAVVGAGLVTARGLTSYETAMAASGPAHCRWGVMATPRSGESWSEAVMHLERKIGRRFSVIRRYHLWDEPLPTKFETWHSRRGRTPYVAWHAFDRSGDPIRWSSIAAGHHDPWIHAQARSLKRWDRAMYFSFHHEPENDTAKCGGAADFRAAWNHVRQIFKSVNVPHLRWVVSLMASTFNDGDARAKAWLPSRYDLLGVDGYNRGLCAGRDEWKTFAEIFGNARRFARLERKGMFIGEFGCVELDPCNNRSGDPQAKARWFHHARATIKSWPEVRAACYSHTATNGNVYWVDSSRSSLRAYRRVSSDPYFT